jgi:hypothetical protein
MQVCVCAQGIQASHLRALAALPQLTLLNLIRVHLAEDAVVLGGLGWLAARLPRLRVLNAPADVLVRPALQAVFNFKRLLRLTAW